MKLTLGEYTATVEWDEDRQEYFGRVDLPKDIVTFRFSPIDGLMKEFATSLDNYIGFCDEQGDEPDPPLNTP